MKLSAGTISVIDPANVILPPPKFSELPERVLQFGAGILLRGLPDYLIDKANRNGIFNGRIVVVKSTAAGDINAFSHQDGLYTICVRGIQNGQIDSGNIISSSISRVLSAHEQWPEVLKCASNPELKIIISNTTEVGIEKINEDINQLPPTSFPGKLCAFLVERYKLFGKNEGGLIIIPTELISENGKKLKSIVLSLAKENSISREFDEWIEEKVRFCDSLVDRIVPGKPTLEISESLQKELAYEDELMIITEPYHLWAIEGDEKVKRTLSFSEADPQVIITPNIGEYRELKLRLLNGTHTLSCAVAHLAGFQYVNQSMNDDSFFSFIKSMMLNEIAPAIPYDFAEGKARDFGLQVIERFSNPYIHHPWLNISMHYTAKLQSRVVPLLLKYFGKYKMVPSHMSFGFAAYLLFMKVVKCNNNLYYGQYNGEDYLINDTAAPVFYELWKTKKIPELVKHVLKNKDLWQYDLSQFPYFSNTVSDLLSYLHDNGVVAGLLDLDAKKSTNQ